MQFQKEGWLNCVGKNEKRSYLAWRNIWIGFYGMIQLVNVWHGLSLPLSTSPKVKRKQISTNSKTCGKMNNPLRKNTTLVSDKDTPLSFHFILLHLKSILTLNRSRCKHLIEGRSTHTSDLYKKLTWLFNMSTPMNSALQVWTHVSFRLVCLSNWFAHAEMTFKCYKIDWHDWFNTIEEWYARPNEDRRFLKRFSFFCLWCVW